MKTQPPLLITLTQPFFISHQIIHIEFQIRQHNVVAGLPRPLHGPKFFWARAVADGGPRGVPVATRVVAQGPRGAQAHDRGRVERRSRFLPIVRRALNEVRRRR